MPMHAGAACAVISILTAWHSEIMMLDIGVLVRFLAKSIVYR